MTRTTLFAAILLLAGADAASAQMPGGAMPPMPVKAVPVASRDFAVKVEAAGTLEAAESAEIRAEVAGLVQEIHFSEGQPVKKGASLVSLDDRLIGAELMKAEAAYNVRKTAFGRGDKLKDAGFLSSQSWEERGGVLQEAEADIRAAKVLLEKAKVPAPFDGVAGLRDFSVGDYVQAGQLLTTVDQTDPMKISFSVPEKNYAAVRPGQKVSFSVDAWPGEAFSGEVYAVSPRVEMETRNFGVKAAIPNPDGRLRPGMFARIGVVTETHQGALAVPEETLIPKGDENYAFAVREGKAVLLKVVTGLREAGMVEIVSGLEAGETVVTAGALKLQDGAAVTVLPP